MMTTKDNTLDELNEIENFVNIYDEVTKPSNTLDEQIDLEKEVKSIGEYLGCNEDELWSEVKPLFESICMNTIGMDDLSYIKSEQEHNGVKNELRKQQRYYLQTILNKGGK